MADEGRESQNVAIIVGVIVGVMIAGVLAVVVCGVFLYMRARAMASATAALSAAAAPALAATSAPATTGPTPEEAREIERLFEEQATSLPESRPATRPASAPARGPVTIVLALRKGGRYAVDGRQVELAGLADAVRAAAAGSSDPKVLIRRPPPDVKWKWFVEAVNACQTAGIPTEGIGLDLSPDEQP